MKRIFALLLAAALLCVGLAGCTQADPSSAPASSEEAVTLRVAGLKGPTSMGLVSLMDKAEAGTAEGNYTFSIATAADELTPKFIQGELDMIAIPVNLASVLYNRTEGDVRLLAVNTLGVLYIVTKNETVASLSDLKGKTIYATGKGSTPEYNLRYLLQQSGVDPDADVTIEFKTEPTEVVSILSEADSAVAMLPQPFVTVAKGSVEGLSVALDLSAEWDKIGNGSSMVTGVLVARKEIAEKYPDAVATFLKEYENSVAYLNENTADGAALVEKYGIVKAAVAEKAIPACNIVFISGADMKAKLDGYLQVLFEQNAASVGGKLPADDFYYTK